MKKMRESELLFPVAEYLRAVGCEIVVPDLPFFDRGIDVYALKCGPRKLAYTVELKLYDWRKALRQAAIYQLCSDFSYVALPESTVSKVDASLFENPGIGILGIDPGGTVSVRLKARRSTEQRPFYRNAFRTSVLEGRQRVGQ